jgi:hypothetical protein
MPIPLINPGRAGALPARLIVLLLFPSVMDPLATAQDAGPREKPPQTADLLTTLNNASRMLYARAKAKALAKEGPVMILVGDDLVLSNGGKRQQARVIPDTYHTLKAFAHIPMAIDVTLAAHADENPLAGETLQELRDYRALFPSAASTIAITGLDGEQRERQRMMVEACVKFLDEVIDGRRCTEADRIAFARRMNPMIMANVAAAARAALDQIHHQVCDWKARMSPEEWKRLTVIVTGRPLPRKDNLAVQYFARLLGLPGEGERLLYAESITDEPRALDLLATRRVDTRIAVDFFNNPERMARDLLADAARNYLLILIDHAESHAPR